MCPSGGAGGGEPFGGVGRGASERLAVDGEGEPVGVVRVAGDVELSLVQRGVVSRAKCHQVPRVGRPVGTPVDDVMDAQLLGAVARRVATRSVAVVDDAPRVVGHDLLRVADVHRGALGHPEGLDGAVAGEQIGHGARQVGAGAEPGVVRVEVQIRAVPIGPFVVGDTGE